MAPDTQSVMEGAATPDSSLATVRLLLSEKLPSATPQTIDELVKRVRLTTMRSGEVIFRQGEQVPLTLLMTGYAAFRRTMPDGRQLIIDIRASGFLIGHASIAGQTATFELFAITPVTVALWRGPDVRRLAASDPGLALDVIDALAQTVIHVTERFDRYVHRNTRHRVLLILAEHADVFFGDPPVVSRTLLPTLVGTSREMTGRVLRSLESDHVIVRVGRRGLQLLDPGPLEAVLHSADAG